MLQPQLRRLVDGLEEELVAVHPLVGPLLEREELVGAEIALIVARALAGQDRGEFLLVAVRRFHEADPTRRDQQARPMGMPLASSLDP